MRRTISRREAILAGIGASTGVGLTSLPQIASGQSYPAKPVKVVAGAAPGGPGDFLARLFAEPAGAALGQAFLVENKPGASGTIAASAAARAAPDGYTLLVTGPTPIVSAPHLFKTLDYDPAKQFTPVCMLGAGGFVLAVHPSVPVNNVAEFIALAKSKPKEVTFGSGGNGSATHLTTELFADRAGVEFLHVPYKGDGPAGVDLIGGQINFVITAPNVVLPHRASGKLKILAVTSRERFASLPDVPTVHETLADFEALSWVNVFAMTGTPQSAIDALAAVWDKQRQEVGVKARLDGLGMYPPQRYTTQAALQAFVASEAKRFAALIKRLGIQPE